MTEHENQFLLSLLTLRLQSPCASPGPLLKAVLNERVTRQIFVDTSI